MSHTPGPWKAGASHVQTDNGVLCVVAQTYSGCDADRIAAHANARLMAAAPDMLAALKAVGEQSISTTDPDMLAISGDVYVQVFNAIAKAEGAR